MQRHGAAVLADENPSSRGGYSQDLGILQAGESGVGRSSNVKLIFYTLRSKGRATY
jgi:hypothetical protein